MLRLALGRGAADELLLASQRVLPKKLADAGYVHAYADLADALKAALAPRSHSSTTS
jgi:NAD dependent epimerase/dehydratase family enzyme